MNIIFLGAPGSGKGTQAAMLAKETKITIISTGEILRKESLKKSNVAKVINSHINSGELVPDDVVIGIIKKQINKKIADKGFILDGFPRNVEQAIKLDEMLFKSNKKIDIVFNFEANEDVLIKRILGRYSCVKCGEIYNHYFKLPKKDGMCDKCDSNFFENRKDDTQKTINNRFKVYLESSVPLTDYYKNNNLLISINALRKSSVIFEDLIQIIQKFY
jgi:adenylate kinase